MTSIRTVPCILLIVAAMRPTYGTTRFTSDFADLVKLAEVIATVQIMGMEVRNNDNWLTTLVTVRVTEISKGSIKRGTEISVEYPGGDDGTTRMVVPGQPKLTIGKTVLLLLAKNRTGWRVVGGDAGQVNLSTNDEGDAVARRASGAFDYYVEDPDALSGYRAVSASIIPVTTLTRIIGAKLTTGRPVLAAVSATPLHNPVQVSGGVSRETACAYPVLSVLAAAALVVLMCAWRSALR